MTDIYTDTLAHVATLDRKSLERYLIEHQAIRDMGDAKKIEGPFCLSDRAEVDRFAVDLLLRRDLYVVANFRTGVHKSRPFATRDQAVQFAAHQVIPYIADPYVTILKIRVAMPGQEESSEWVAEIETATKTVLSPAQAEGFAERSI